MDKIKDWKLYNIQGRAKILRKFGHKNLIIFFSKNVKP